MDAEVDRILLGKKEGQNAVSPKNTRLLKEAGIIDEQEAESLNNSFSSINEYDFYVYSMWLIVKEQAIYTSGMVSLPITLDIQKVIFILRFYGLRDEYLSKWFLDILLYMANRIFMAHIEVFNSRNKD